MRLLVLYDGLTLDSVYNQILSSNSEGIIYGSQNIDPYNEKYGKDAIELPVDKIHYRDYYYWGHHINNKNIYGTNSIAKWFIIPERAYGQSMDDTLYWWSTFMHVCPKGPQGY